MTSTIPPVFSSRKLLCLCDAITSLTSTARSIPAGPRRRPRQPCQRSPDSTLEKLSNCQTICRPRVAWPNASQLTSYATRGSGPSMGFTGYEHSAVPGAASNGP
eukprot:scaffold318855_cov43-Prasinocladus_malaysianus.AAC.1